VRGKGRLPDRRRDTGRTFSSRALPGSAPASRAGSGTLKRGTYGSAAAAPALCPGAAASSKAGLPPAPYV